MFYPRDGVIKDYLTGFFPPGGDHCGNPGAVLQVSDPEFRRAEVDPIGWTAPFDCISGFDTSISLLIVIGTEGVYRWILVRWKTEGARNYKRQVKSQLRFRNY